MGQFAWQEASSSQQNLFPRMLQERTKKKRRPIKPEGLISCHMIHKEKHCGVDRRLFQNRMEEPLALQKGNSICFELSLIFDIDVSFLEQDVW